MFFPGKENSLKNKDRNSAVALFRQILGCFFLFFWTGSACSHQYQNIIYESLVFFLWYQTKKKQIWQLQFSKGSEVSKDEICQVLKA